MKLLFDQNLAPRLVSLLADIYPDSLHVRDAGLDAVEDVELWNYAKTYGFTIVSKDVDFQKRSLLYGFPPKFVWLRLGNCSVAESAALLRKFSPLIHTFGHDSAKAHLILP